MIIEAIISVLVFLLLGVLSLFPSLPALPLDFLDGVVQALSLLDTFISLRIISGCFVAVLILHNAHILWGVVMWVVRKIPGLE